MSKASSDKGIVSADATLFAAGELDANDPSLYEQIVEPWELLAAPSRKGQFGYQIHYFKTPSITVYQEHFDLACRVRGQSPLDTFVFCVPLQLGQGSTYWKSSLSESGLPIMARGGLDMTVDAGHRHLIVLVNRARLISSLPTDVTNFLKRAAIDHHLPATSIEVKRFGNWLLNLLGETCRWPQLYVTPCAIKALEEDLLCRLSNLVQPTGSRALRQKPLRRPRGFDLALELAHSRSADLTSLTIPQLSDAAGISIRNLEYAFRQAFDLTPLAYLRLQRFHLARRHLAMAGPGEKTVAHIACEHGFNHLGRFSAQYRGLFGELPSNTLTQCYSSPGGNLRPLISNLRRHTGSGAGTR